MSVSAHQLNKDIKKEIKKDLKQETYVSNPGKEEPPPVCETGGGLPHEGVDISKERG